MNKIKSYLYLTCLVLFFAGCTEKFVDLESDDRLSPQVIYNTIEGVESSVPGIYAQGREFATWEDGCPYKYGPSDLETPGTNIRDDDEWSPAYLFVTFDSENTFIKRLWESLYKGLHKCNAALESFDVITINENDVALVARRDAVKGVALFFRAYFHLQLVQRWDNIVLADHLFSDTSEEIKLASKEDVYDLIISDLTTAIALLPEASSITSDRGHVTKGVARLTLAKAYMDVEEWALAAGMASDVVDDPAYRLVALDEVFSVAYQDNAEIILSWQFTQAEGGSNLAQRLSNKFLPLYNRASGLANTFDHGGRPYARLIPNDYYWTLFEEDDLRLHAWHNFYYIYNTDAAEDPLPEGVNLGDTVTLENVVMQEPYSPEDILRPTTRKHWEDGSFGRAIGFAEGWRNIIQYRLAEAYIIAAEAHYRAGDIPAGLPFINALRDRADVDPFTTITDDIILDEHARELGHEGNRYEMLKRLDLLLPRIQEYNPEVGFAMQEHNVRWPIPYGFQKLTKVSQNTGYN